MLLCMSVVGVRKDGHQSTAAVAIVDVTSKEESLVKSKDFGRLSDLKNFDFVSLNQRSGNLTPGPLT